MIWAWHHGDEGEPFYEVPEVAGAVRRRTGSPYELVEFDVATLLPGDGREQRRLRPLHVRARHRRRSPTTSSSIDGTYKRTVGARRQLRARGLRARARRAARRRLHDLHLVDDPDRRGEREGALDLHRAASRTVPTRRKQAAVDFSAGVSQDLPIWENKRYVERPVLTKSEKKLLEQRAVGQAVLFELQAERGNMTAWVGQYCIYVRDLERGGEVLRGARARVHQPHGSRHDQRSDRREPDEGRQAPARAEARPVDGRSRWATRSGSCTSHERHREVVRRRVAAGPTSRPRRCG